MSAPEAPARFEARLVAARALTPSVRELTFEREGGVPLRFAPGQWVNLFANEGGELKRSYSIASPPSDTGRFELAVTRVPGGPMSEHLHRLRVGAAIGVSGPHGLFTRDAADARPALFVATGTGLAPLRSMIGAALARPEATRLRLLLGVRHEEDLLYRDELDAWAARDPRFSWEPTLSRPPAGWTGRTGWVQTHLPELVQSLGPKDDITLFVCGLERMVKTVRELARGELGLGRRQVQHEKFD